jgi:hypothetical protein
MQDSIKPGRRYRNMVWVGRVNGPLVCAGCILSAFVALFGPQELPSAQWTRVIGFLVLAAIFVSSAIWTKQSWKTKL